MITKRAIIVIAIVCLSGCAKHSPRIVLRSESGHTTAASERLAAAIEKNRREASSIRALAWMLIGDAEEERQTEAAIAIASPAKVRVDAMDALADVWAEAGSDGAVMWLYLPAKHKLYSGKASIANLHRVAKFDFEVWEIADILGGSPPIKPGTAIAQVGKGKDSFFLAEGTRLQIWTDGKEGRISKMVRLGADGSEVEYSVEYGDYKKLMDIWFPHRIEARFPSRGARIVIQYKSVSLGSQQEGSSFLPPKRGGDSKIQYIR